MGQSETYFVATGVLGRMPEIHGSVPCIVLIVKLNMQYTGEMNMNSLEVSVLLRRCG